MAEEGVLLACGSVGGDGEHVRQGSMGIQQSTYLIGPDSKISRAWTKVNVDGPDAAVQQSKT